MNQSILLILIIGLVVISTTAFASNINFIDVAVRHWGASPDTNLDCVPDPDPNSPTYNHCTQSANLDMSR